MSKQHNRELRNSVYVVEFRAGRGGKIWWPVFATVVYREAENERKRRSAQNPDDHYRVVRYWKAGAV